MKKEEEYNPAKDGKFSKEEVDFEHPAKGKHDCDECVHFRSKSLSCEIVSGRVEGEDWCKKWVGKKKS